MRRAITAPRWTPSHRAGAGQVRHSHGHARHVGVLAAMALAVALALAVSACAASPADAQISTPTTPQGRLGAQLQQILQGTRDTDQITYDPTQRTLVVRITLATAVPRTDEDVQRAQARVKSLCFQAQRAAWIVGLPLATAKVVVVGPMLDGYADLIIRNYGSAVLTLDNAQGFVWESLTPESAWTRYDSTTLSTEFAPSFQGWDVTPTAMPGTTPTAAPTATP